jgi:hypothetical protein
MQSYWKLEQVVYIITFRLYRLNPTPTLHLEIISRNNAIETLLINHNLNAELYKIDLNQPAVEQKWDASDF